MDVFDLRRRLVDDFADYTRSFVVIRDELIRDRVDRELAEGLLWPHPIVQLNPAFESGGTIDDLVDEGLLHERCVRRAASNLDAGAQTDAVRVGIERGLRMPTRSPSPPI
jgi:hypothetical protein